jgi:hypothetical protein
MNSKLTESGSPKFEVDDAPKGHKYPNAYAALPKNSKEVTCPHTGLHHAHLAKLLKPGGLAAGHVRVIALREPGARHSKTLFHVGDMLKWLDGLAAKQSTQALPGR